MNTFTCVSNFFLTFYPPTVSDPNSSIEMREETPSLRTESTPLFPADEPPAVVTTLHEPSPTPAQKSKHGWS